MRGLTPHNILEVWEWAQSEYPANKALALLFAANPDTSWEQLANLSIGQRDARLLELREMTFGHEIQAYVQCQACGEDLEFALSTHDMRISSDVLDTEHTVELMGKQSRFRLPNSIDLMAVSHLTDYKQAASELLQRCILEITCDGETVKQEVLSQEFVSALAEQMAQRDSQAEILLNLHCPACEQDGQALFDINSFIWNEFVDLAKRLLHQVHWLAHGYGWAETDILAMSAWRRQYYQELLGA